MTTLFIIILFVFQLNLLFVIRRLNRSQEKHAAATIENIAILETMYEASEAFRNKQARRLDDLEKKFNDRNGYELTATDKALSGIRIDIMNLQKQHDELKQEFQEETETNDTSLKHIEDEIKFLYGLEDRIRTTEEILVYQVSAGSTLAGLQEKVNQLVQGNDAATNEGEAPTMETGLEPGLDRESQLAASVRDL